MSKLERSFDFILNLFAGIAAVLLVVMMLATVLKVVLRALFNHGILGIDQISGTMMVYITFLGAAWVLRRDGHVSVDILTANLRPQAQRMVMFVSSLIGAAVCFVLTWFGTTAVLLSLQRGIVVAAELEIPRAVNLWVIPLGCLLLGFEFLRRAVRFRRGDAVISDTPRLEA
ncbi:TRAP transporter small permease [Pseudaminobacter arsenicus]|uniref:TRAP transporter small permease protein n=1 Tax=Borborobacter arsenicus TaxID=1851146 RepID=A0A432V245_9HYPH|nr:TRAP transporter small permease [Pseudaminobacter arsenicus]RUM96195.1 TRAP transporter small permease [Pseudaminobacter arsenicus]